MDRSVDGGMPWVGASDLKTVVNTDPSSRWRITVTDAIAQGSNVAGNRPERQLTKRIHQEEVMLRDSLSIDKKLPNAASTIPWSSLDPQMQFLGQGEFATAHRTLLCGKPVAVKMLKKSKQEDAAALQGIKREIMLMTLMHNPHVLPGAHCHVLPNPPAPNTLWPDLLTCKVRDGPTIVHRFVCSWQPMHSAKKMANPSLSSSCYSASSAICCPRTLPWCPSGCDGSK